MFRTRFARQIVAEFLPPARPRHQARVIILCDGMPGIPRKQPLVEFLARRGYWTFYPRWRGAWESDGQFLQRSPEQDLRDIIDALPRPIRELAFGRRFHLHPHEIFVIGGSFGGAAAILAALDPRVKKVVANCPVVDWSILKHEQKKETSNPSYPAFIRDAFGRAYRLSAKNWNKLSRGDFFNPARKIGQLDPAKILIFHAKDDPYIPWRQVANFAGKAGIELHLAARGGHARTEDVVRHNWSRIRRFFQA